MRTFILRGLIAATLLTGIAPGFANAQSARELRGDRQDIREEQRELRDAYRRGDRDDIRDERRDVREARQEYREDRRDFRQDRRDDWRDGRRDGRGDARFDRDRRWGRDDWRGWRQGNRNLYARGNWQAPFRYQTFRPGVRIAGSYWGPRYVINDPWRYRLPQASGYQRWVRHYDDVVLVDTRRSVVVDVIRGFYW